MWQYAFMKNALLAVLLVTPVFGLLGTMVVNNKMAFFSDSIGHSALTGIAVGVLLGMNNPLWAMLLFSIFLSVLISFVKAENLMAGDTVISVFASTMIALGIVVLSRERGFARFSSYLVGDLLSIAPSDIVLLAIVLLLVLIFWVFFFNRLLIVSISPSLAASRDMGVRTTEMVFTVVVAVIVTVSIRWVGILIINSLLVLPAAAARNISAGVRRYHAVSVAIAIISGISGLVLSYWWDTATGATIVLVCAVFFFATFAYRFIRK